MPININQSRINAGSGTTGKTSAQKRGNDFVVPAKAVENNIPSPKSLETMIRSAVSALRSGVFWDRGTIINILA